MRRVGRVLGLLLVVYIAWAIYANVTAPNPPSSSPPTLTGGSCQDAAGINC